MEKMKFYTLKRESNKFDDVTSDINIKKWIGTKISWSGHLMIGFNFGTPESVYGYLVLKYGECLCNPVNKDYTPIPNKDYIPKRN